MLKGLGEFLSFTSSVIEIGERGAKTYKRSMKIGFVRYLIQACAYLLLGGINGFIVTMMAFIRQIFLYQKKFTSKVILVWIFISGVINIIFASSFLDLFPFAATIQFTVMCRKQNTLSLKWAGLVNTVIWLVYHISQRNYVYLFFAVVVILTTAIRILRGVEK